jgi:ABC-type multidrug transport system fused ATPase/permease subunit
LSLAYVSIQRLEQFFDEPEVDSWVSALHDQDQGQGQPISTSSSSSENDFVDIGIIDGTFKYSEQARLKNDNGSTSKTSKTTTIDEPLDSSREEGEEVNEVVVEEEPEFELRDVNVSFPTGRLSLVSGPTGSGKSSLFLALLGGE